MLIFFLDRQRPRLAKLLEKWGNTPLERVVPKERIQNWNNAAKLRRRFLYVVAVDMAEKGYLDYHGKPSNQALINSKNVCPPYEPKEGFHLKDRYRLLLCRFDVYVRLCCLPALREKKSVLLLSI